MTTEIKFVNCKLQVRGQECQVFRDAVKDNDSCALQLSTLIPIPEDVTPDKIREWKVYNWGTQYEIPNSSVHLQDNGDELIYYFTTAWIGPEPWIREASLRYPSLTFDYSVHSPYESFAGRVTYNNGEASRIREYERTSHTREAFVEKEFAFLRK